MKFNYYKLGSSSFVILGLLHISHHFYKQGKGTDEVLNAYSIMKNTSIQFLGEHNILQFYNGYSFAMGLLLVCFGTQAYLNDKPSKKIIIFNLLTAIATTIISVVYFHPLAYGCMIMSVFFFTLTARNQMGNRE